jgi:VWFA-related protein
MARWRLVQLLCFPLALAAAASFAEDGTDNAKSVLRIETRLIEVNVVAQDSIGRAVKGLTRKDFKLFDNGKEVPIDVFAAESIEATSRETTPLPPHTFTNRVPGVPPSVTVILLDGLNTSFEDQTWARTQVVRFLEDLEPQERVAIMLLGDHLYMLQDFSSDPKTLLAALKGMKARIPTELEASTPPNPAGEPQLENPDESAQRSDAGAQQAREKAIMEKFLEHERGYFYTDRVGRTLSAFLEIAGFLKRFPGRKNLIWVSAGFPIAIGFQEPRSPGDTRPQTHFGPEIEGAFKALNNADMAIYPVDARGLVAAAPRSMDWNTFHSTLGAMKDLSDHTGGRTFFNTNDLARVIRTAVNDSQADYTLGFYPHNIRWDGTYHKLKVKVNRPDVHLRNRKGYYAALDRPENPEQANALIQRALNSPLDATGLGLTVELEKDPEDPTKKVLLRIAMDAHNIRLQDKDGSRAVALEMVFVQSGADGKVLHASREDVSGRLEGNAMDRLRNQGLRMRKSLDLVKGANVLQLVVRDTASGNIGSVRIPLGGQ